MNFIEENNIPECAELLIKTFNREPWNDQWTSETALKYLKEFLSFPRFVGFMIVEDGKAVGAAFCHEKTWWTGDELYVDEFYISPDTQRKGYGKVLLQHIEHYIKDRGLSGFILLTDRNTPATRFDENNGFKEVNDMILMFKGVRGDK